MSDVEAIPDDHFSRHFVGRLWMTVQVHDGVATARAPVQRECFAVGSTTHRTGILATYLDVVGGHAPNGALAPTLDLRVQVVGPTPQSGDIVFRAVPLRVGRRFVVTATTMAAADSGVVFAHGVTTFLNNELNMVIPAPPPIAPYPMAEGSFDAFVGPMVHDERSLAVQLDRRLSNGHQGTMQGGAQALLAELVAQHAIGRGPMTARELDIRYLDRLRGEFLLGIAEPSPAHADGSVPCRVRLIDRDEGHLVAYVTLLMVAA